MVAERAENSSKLTIKYVMTKYSKSVVQVTSSSVGKLVELETLTEESKRAHF